MNKGKVFLDNCVAALQIIEDMTPYLNTIPPQQIALSLPIILSMFAYKYSDSKEDWSNMIDDALKPILENKDELYLVMENLREEPFDNKGR